MRSCVGKGEKLLDKSAGKRDDYGWLALKKTIARLVPHLSMSNSQSLVRSGATLSGLLANLRRSLSHPPGTAASPQRNVDLAPHMAATTVHD